ncbi:MAG TPA: hypothetical protein VF572_00510 [Candidatus Saccharimonadales bacterium]|jgi:hypothetical protein
MTNTFARISRSLTIGLTVATLIGATAGFSLANPSSVSAAEACDKINIIYCGLEGTSEAQQVASLKSKLAANSDNGHTDLRAVYGWAGADTTDMSTLSTSNTKLGTIYRNGEIKVDGKTVGKDAWVSARFTEGDGFVKVTDGVWARKTTTSFANASQPILVHYDANGQMDWASIVDCGNAVKATPVKVPTPAPTPTPTPTPTPVTPAYACTLLSVTKGEGRTVTINDFKQTSGGGATYAYTIVEWGDNLPSTKATTDVTGLKHTYAKDGTYKITATAFYSVNNGTVSNTSDACSKTVTFATPVTPAVVKEEVAETPEVEEVAVEQPETLVEAGPGALAGIFAATSAAGATIHHFVRRRLNRG